MRATGLAAFSLLLSLAAARHGPSKPGKIVFDCTTPHLDCYYRAVNQFVLDECTNIGGNHLYPPESKWHYQPYKGYSILSGFEATCLCAHGDCKETHWNITAGKYPPGHMDLTFGLLWDYNTCGQPGLEEEENANGSWPMLELEPGTTYYREGKAYTV